MIVLLSNSDLFDKLYQEINRQNTFYFWIIGIITAIAIAIAGFFGVLQWRLSSKQIDKLKTEIEDTMLTKYKLDGLYSDVNGLKERMILQENFSRTQGLSKLSLLNNVVGQIAKKDPQEAAEGMANVCHAVQETIDNNAFPSLLKGLIIRTVKENLENYYKANPNDTNAKSLLEFIDHTASKYIELAEKDIHGSQD